jgi:hypothetical protein
MGEVLIQAENYEAVTRGSEVSPPAVARTPHLSAFDGGAHTLSKSIKKMPGAERDSCRWCLKLLGPRRPSGRKRIYCSQSCRQRAYKSRKRSKQLGLDEGKVVVSTIQATRLVRRLKDLQEAAAAVESAGLDSSDARMQELCAAVRALGHVAVAGSFKETTRQRASW